MTRKGVNKAQEEEEQRQQQAPAGKQRVNGEIEGE